MQLTVWWTRVKKCMNWSDVSKLLLANSVELESFRTVCWEFSYRTKTVSFNPLIQFVVSFQSGNSFGIWDVVFHRVCRELSYPPIKRCCSTPAIPSFLSCYDVFGIWDDVFGILGVYLVFAMLYFVQCVGNSVTHQKDVVHPLILFFCMFSSIRQLIWYLGCCISYSVQGIELPTKKV